MLCCLCLEKVDWTFPCQFMNSPIRMRFCRFSPSRGLALLLCSLAGLLLTPPRSSWTRLTSEQFRFPGSLVDPAHPRQHSNTAAVVKADFPSWTSCGPGPSCPCEAAHARRARCPSLVRSARICRLLCPIIQVWSRYHLPGAAHGWASRCQPPTWPERTR